MQPWLAELFHDLVRPLLWRARDCASLPEGTERTTLLRAVLDELYDSEGAPMPPLALWRGLLARAPDTVPDETRTRLGGLLARAVSELEAIVPEQPASFAPAQRAVFALAEALDALRQLDSRGVR